MYRIRRKYYCRKQEWLLNLLFVIEPHLFRKCPTKDECRNNLFKILKIIEETKLRWHRGTFDIHYMRRLQIEDDKIIIKTKGGKCSFALTIEEE